MRPGLRRTAPLLAVILLAAGALSAAALRSTSAEPDAVRGQARAPADTAADAGTAPGPRQDTASMLQAASAMGSCR